MDQLLVFVMSILMLTGLIVSGVALDKLNMERNRRRLLMAAMSSMRRELAIIREDLENARNHSDTPKTSMTHAMDELDKLSNSDKTPPNTLASMDWQRDVKNGATQFGFEQWLEVYYNNNRIT